MFTSKNVSLISCLISMIYLFGLTTTTAEVWIVDRHGTDIKQVQEAVDQAAEGDTILIEEGTYRRFYINNKSLSVAAAEFGKTVIIEGIWIRNLEEDKNVVLIGLTTRPDYKGTAFGNYHDLDKQGLILGNNTGSVRVEDCTLKGMDGMGLLIWPWFHPDGWEGTLIHSCDDVAFSRCMVDGGNG
ncbi:MAG: hypothetical protein KJ645_04630, partial [Planctomycetes bacterium]|nr:hypothetical protein [Planctomycetota bacterium]